MFFPLAHDKKFFALPYLQNADYPNVYVAHAEYKNKVLAVELIPGDANAGDETTLVVGNVKKIKKVLLNGSETKNYKFSKNLLTLSTKLGEKNEFVFNVE